MKITVTQKRPKVSTYCSLLWENQNHFFAAALYLALAVLPAMAQNPILVKGRITNEKTNLLRGHRWLLRERQMVHHRQQRVNFKSMLHATEH
jgi:hypothetical protein